MRLAVSKPPNASLISCLGQQVGVAKQGKEVVEVKPDQGDRRGEFVSCWSLTDQLEKKLASILLARECLSACGPPAAVWLLDHLSNPSPLGQGWCVTLIPPPDWQGCAPRFHSFGRGGEIRFQTGFFSPPFYSIQRFVFNKPRSS